IYALANLIVYTDALDLLLRLHVRRRHTAAAGTSADNRNVSIDLAGSLPGGARRLVPLRPYAIIASVFNLGDRLDEFIEVFAAYGEGVWLISEGPTDDTLIGRRQEGGRCFEGGVNRRKPAAVRLLLEKLPPHIETVMVIDPDIQIRGVGAGSSVEFE